MRWRRTWAGCWLLASLTALAPSTGRADEPSAPVALTAGQAAPYDGVLLTLAQAEEAVKQLAFLRLVIDDFQKRLTVRDRTHQLKLDNLQAEWEAERKATKEKHDLDITEYRKRLEAFENPPFWKQNEFHRLLGMLIGIAVGLAAGGL